MTTLFEKAAILCSDAAASFLPCGYVLVDGSEIRYVGETRPEGSFDAVIASKGKLLLPGLINAHTHLPMSLLRSYGGGCDLQTWLHEKIFPVEAKLDERAVRIGTKLALAELIAAGVTCVADMYMFCDAIADEIVKAGLSANIARGLTLFSDEFDANTHAGFADMCALKDKWHGYGGGQILVDACIHGEYTSRPALWTAVADYAAQHALGMHIHISETRAEHEACLARYGKTPTQILDEHGMWNTRAIAAHCVWTSEADWEILQKRAVTVVHNPVSNLKLGSGIAPIVAMKKAGVRVALGTDGVSSNNNHDMFEEMKLAAIVQAGAHCAPQALSAGEAFRMATREGAEALGRNTGKIQAGCVADLILLDLSAPNLMPLHSAVDSVVYAARGSNVCMNMARGQIIYKDGVHLTLDLAALQSELQSYALPLLFGEEAKR